ncbi:hypothetical protein ACLD02_06020 [Alloalcanivorax sp. C16-2]|uniref:hypothetical protein n=1 Tax=Alloalcanivorax sp. C16-2 TaxID=3390052 RepID=UPI003970FF2C
MESTLIEFDEKAADLKDYVDKLKGYIGNIPISKNLRDGFKSFYQHLDAYSAATKRGDIEKIASSASAVAIYGQVIGQGIAQFKDADSQMKNIGSDLLRKSNEYRDLTENSPLEYKPMEPIDSKEADLSLANYQSIKNNFKQISNDHIAHDQRIKKLLNESESNAVKLSGQIEKLEREVKSEIEKITSFYKEAKDEIDSKKQQIDDVLGHVSGRAIAGDFETSSADEKKMADWLRCASLGCMAVIVAVVCYSFWETTTEDFQWQSSVFRMVLAVMLSVPAAYLARESAKHREQQYNHLQTSLDLKAISPYIASLPIDEQHKIKIQIANRLFAAGDYSKVGADPYPINVHEIVMEIIKKLELNKHSKSD